MRATVVPAVNATTALRAHRQLALAALLGSAVQIDCADGAFVPRRTLGPAATGALPVPPGSELHLMVREPERWVATAQRLRVGRVAFHIEAIPDPRPLIAALRVYNIDAIAAANPSTPLVRLLRIQPMVRGLMLLGVHPGPSGSRFLPRTVARVRTLRRRLPRMDLAVDGGIDDRTLPLLRAAGANRFVVGSAIFHAPNPLWAYRRLVRACR